MIFHRVLVSTDDAEIAAMARQYGAEVPFLRPADLGGDRIANVAGVAACHSICRKCKTDIQLDWVFLLQPTAPLRTS